MEAYQRAAAEARLLEAAGGLGLADPRPPFRDRLRRLRESNPAAFERAIGFYETVVLPALAGQDPLRTWAEYGSFLGGLTAEGHLAAIDTSGRSTSYPGNAADLVLFLPDGTSDDVLVVMQPLQPSAAQAATIELLVNRRLALG